jgi:sugar phosphate permease
MYVFYRDRESESPHAPTPRGLAGELARIVRNRSLLALTADGFLRVGTQYCLLTYLILYLQRDLHLPLIVAASYLALTQAAAAIGRIGWGLVSDRLFGGHRRPVYIAVALLAAGMFLVVSELEAQTPAWIVALVVALLGATAAGFQGVGMSLTAEIVGHETAGIASGFWNSVAFLGAVLLTPAFGLVVDWSGSYPLAWKSLMLASLLAAALVALAKEVRKPLLATRAAPR